MVEESALLLEPPELILGAAPIALLLTAQVRTRAHQIHIVDILPAARHAARILQPHVLIACLQHGEPIRICQGLALHNAQQFGRAARATRRLYRREVECHGSGLFGERLGDVEYFPFGHWQGSNRGGRLGWDRHAAHTGTHHAC